jgi:hypothetical protein
MQACVETRKAAAQRNAQPEPIVLLNQPDYPVQKASPAVNPEHTLEIFSQVIEKYLVGCYESEVVDIYAERVIATVLESWPKLLQDPQNPTHRADLLWASTVAIHELPIAGKQAPPSIIQAIVQAIKHFYPGVNPVQGLGALYPAYFRWLWDNNRSRKRFAQLARHLFASRETYDYVAGIEFIERFDQWLDSVDLYQSLPDLGIKTRDYEAIADYAVQVYQASKLPGMTYTPGSYDITSLLWASEKQESNILVTA